MSNRYLDLDGDKNVSETYQKIPAGFDGVQADVDANKLTMDTHIANNSIHVTAAKKAEWDSKAPGSTQVDLEAHTSNEDIHVTAEQKEDWDSKAPGITASDLAAHIADMVAHLTEEEHDKLAGIQDGAQANQNAFSTIGTIAASSPTDSITFEAGTGISITYNATTKKVTITATGEATPGPHGGSHDEDGSDPIPDLVQLKGVVAGQATDIANAQSTAEAAQTAAETAQSTADAAETPAGAQAKADAAQEAAEDYADGLIKTGLFGTTTGSANTYAITVSPAPTLVAGLRVTIKINVANTGASTLNVNGLGAKSLLKSNGNAMASGNLRANGVYTFVYDGTNFILQGEGGEYGTAAAGDVRSGKTIGTDSGLVNGTLVTRDSGGAVTVTPGTSAQTLNAGIYDHPIVVAPGSGLTDVRLVPATLGTAYDQSYAGVPISLPIATIPAGVKYMTFLSDVIPGSSPIYLLTYTALLALKGSSGLTVTGTAYYRLRDNNGLTVTVLTRSLSAASLLTTYSYYNLISFRFDANAGTVTTQQSYNNSSSSVTQNVAVNVYDIPSGFNTNGPVVFELYINITSMSTGSITVLGQIHGDLYY